MLNIIVGRFKQNLDLYLQDLESSPVRTLDEMIAFNEAHAEKAMPAREYFRSHLRSRSFS